MQVLYTIISTIPLSETMSRVTVHIKPAAPINGFHGETISFTAPTASLEAEIAKRAKWKMKQETKIDVESKDILAY